MEKKNHKEVIHSILSKSGKVLRSDLKELVMHKMGLENYPKQTFAYHIDKLVEEGKIKREESDSNNEYLFIPKIVHPVHGGLIIESLKGRIHVPELLAGFDISILDAIPLTTRNDHLLFIFQFNSISICLKIPKIAIPFKLHISRKKYEKEIYQEVIKEFGSRTITLELPILQLSSFPLDNLNSDKKGQMILNFEDDNLSIQDLNSTNPSETANLKNLNYETFLNELSLFTNFTVDSKFEKRSSTIIGKAPVQRHKEQVFKLPLLILLSSDSQLVIF